MNGIQNHNYVINLESVTVSYPLYDVRYNTFKEFVMNFLKRNNKVRYHQALNDVTLKISKGESVGLLGHNGCGKSTLLKVIAGILEPENKTIAVRGRIAPMIELGAGFDMELSGYENIQLSCAMMGLTEKEIKEKIDQIIDFANVRDFIHIPVKNYSSGMLARLGFSCVTSVDADILLVDEVLAVGDANFAKKCLERIDQLRELGATVVFVSHDINAVTRFCNRGIVLESGVIRYDGPVSTAAVVHAEIMEERRYQSLSVEMQKAERERNSRSKVDSSGLMRPDELPSNIIEASIIQVRDQGGDLGFQRVDLAKPFSLKFKIETDRAFLFEGDVTFGIELRKSTGVRIGGFNNLTFSQPIEILKTDTAFVWTVEFEFKEGLVHIAADILGIIVGIHDNNLRRTVYIDEIIKIDAVNSLLGTNTDGDVLNLKDFVTNLSLDFKR